MIERVTSKVEIGGRRGARLVIAALLTGLAAVGPTGCSSSNSAPDGGVVEPLTPVPAPEGLLATGFAPTPDATWARARAAIGGPSAFFPQSFGGLASTGLGLPITVAGEIDGDVPVLAALASPVPDGKLRFVAGIHVKVGERFLDQLTRGDAARFTSAMDAPSHIALLTAKTGPQGSVVMGLLGNYLLVSTKKEDLLALGPYVARTMPTLPAPKEDVTIEATPGALSSAEIGRLKASWEAVKAQAVAAQAPVLLGQRVDALFDILGDVSSAKATLTLGEGAVHARAFVVPKPDGGPASKAAADLGVGDAKPLLDLPATAQVAVQLRAPASKDAADPAADFALSAVGKDFSDADKEAIKAAFHGLRDATGGYGALGIGLLPTGPIAFGRVPVSDEAAASKALADVAALVKLPGFKARLDESHVAVTIGKTVVENLPGDVQRLRLGKKDAKDDDKPKKDEPKGVAKDKKAAVPTEPPSHVDLLWLVQNGFAVGAVGLDAKDALRAMVKATPEASLGADPNVKAAIDALGSDVAFALFADVPRLVAARVGKPAPPTSAPLVFSFGKTGAKGGVELQAKLDVANAALQDLIRNRSAF